MNEQPLLQREEGQPAQRLAEALARLARPVALRFNNNRRILISLRGGGPRPLVLSIHPGLLGYPLALADLPAWVARGGRRPSPAIYAALEGLGRVVASAERPQDPRIELEPLGAPLDLEAAFRAVHAAYFPNLSLPSVAWARRGGRRRPRHLRFASYRARPPRVLVSRRLDQPWVAREYVRFVLYHELCHHALAMEPRRGDTAHGPRFRSLERQFPDYPLLVRWERQQLGRFIDGEAADHAATPPRAGAGA
jgi:hypothetical protein